MRKEIAIAIILGLILGGIIIYGVQLANQSSLKAKRDREASRQNSSESPTPIPTPSAAIIITSPNDHSVIFSNPATVAGSTLPNSTIIVSDSEDDTAVTTDSSGKFSAQIKLTGGENKLTISALTGDQLNSTAVTAIYTTAKIITPTPNPVDAPIASSSQEIVNKTKEEILKKAQEQFKQTEENLNTKSNIAQLVGYKGAITNIAQNAITVVADKINLQVSFDAGTTIIKDGRPIKPDQLSIKDAVIVIGYSIGNEVITAKRIVVIKETSPEPTKKIVFSPINKINLKSKSLSITIDGQEQILVLGKKLKLDLNLLQTGQRLFGVILLPNNPKDPATLFLAKII